MSIKKERKIKKMRHMAVWPAVLEMIISVIVLYTLAAAICTFTIVSLLDSQIIRNDQEARKVVAAVNQEWNTKDRDKNLDQRMQNLLQDLTSIEDIYIIKESDNSLLKTYGQDFADLPQILSQQNQKRYEHEKVLYFMEDPQTSFTSLDFGLFNPDKFFRAFLLTNLLKYSKMMDWATNENSSVKALALFKTDHSGIAVCVRIKYSLTSFMSSVFITIVLFFLFIVILCGILGISRVVRFAAEARRLNLLVNTDSITGGFNKEYFTTRANKLVRRGKRKYAIVQLRLEKYRNFCITYGLKKGENLLEDINTNISQIIDKKEVLAHVEKSDFALLLFYDSQTSMEKRIKSIMNLLRAKIKPQHLTFSAGVCLAPSSFTDITSLLTYAGLAIPKTLTMQDEIAWFTDSMKEEQIWERQIEDDMKRGISKHEFAVYLQPKYSTKDEKLAAAEALVRWNHPTFGFISPGRFIPIFEKNGFILQLDDYMLTEVAKIQARWISQGKKLVPISVNVSRAHFAEENLAEHICSVVDGYNVPHQFIELELTESAFFDDKAVLLNTIKKLKTYGFKVSMDDFGAGYSSLNSLKELPLDIIKIDAEFFRSVDDTVRSKKIVAQTIMLAKELGMQVVAEGIENRPQVDFLAKMNCDLIQGFYFSKPLPLKEFEERAYPGLGQS